MDDSDDLNVRYLKSGTHYRIISGIKYVLVFFLGLSSASNYHFTMYSVQEEENDDADVVRGW